MFQGLRKNRIVTLPLVLFYVLVSICFITIRSHCSFLYRVQEWVDDNFFLTIGRAIYSGKVLYVDIYDQKGPFIFVIYGLSSILFRPIFPNANPFLGMYFFQLAFWTLTLVFVAKIISFYHVSDWAYYYIPVLFIAFVTLSKPYETGGSVEELAIPLFTVSLYLFLKQFYQGFSFTDNVLLGMLAALILWTKYTILGFWIGIGLCMVILGLVRGTIKVALKNAGGIFLGLGLVTVAPMTYFLLNEPIKRK